MTASRKLREEATRAARRYTRSSTKDGDASPGSLGPMMASFVQLEQGRQAIAGAGARGAALARMARRKAGRQLERQLEQLRRRGREAWEPWFRRAWPALVRIVESRCDGAVPSPTWPGWKPDDALERGVPPHVFDRPARGVCRICGCTDANPCRGVSNGEPIACSWVDTEHTICSRCAGTVSPPTWPGWDVDRALEQPPRTDTLPAPLGDRFPACSLGGCRFNVARRCTLEPGTTRTPDDAKCPAAQIAPHPFDQLNRWLPRLVENSALEPRELLELLRDYGHALELLAKGRRG
jgi:hypothetical protein